MLLGVQDDGLTCSAPSWVNPRRLNRRSELGELVLPGTAFRDELVDQL